MPPISNHTIHRHVKKNLCTVETLWATWCILDCASHYAFDERENVKYIFSLLISILRWRKWIRGLNNATLPSYHPFYICMFIWILHMYIHLNHRLGQPYKCVLCFEKIIINWGRRITSSCMVNTAREHGRLDFPVCRWTCTNCMPSY
jgi:hypothetical protein